MSAQIGIPDEWAWMRQVHGAEVIRVKAPGLQGDGDAAFTEIAMVPIAVSTADCYPVIVEAAGAVGIAHAGWRGAASGVIAALVEAMTASGHQPVRAAIGPGIGGCCFEVGPEVAARFPGHQTTTGWGTAAVDLAAVIRTELGDIDIWASGICTMSDDGYHSHRRDATRLRQVAVAWLPG